MHLILVDLRESELDGQQGEDRLHEIGITVNRNAVPFDPRPPMVSSGLRIGTPALATRGVQVEDFAEIGRVIAAALQPEFDARRDELAERVRAIAERYPAVPGLPSPVSSGAGREAGAADAAADVAARRPLRLPRRARRGCAADAARRAAGGARRRCRRAARARALAARSTPRSAGSRSSPGVLSPALIWLPIDQQTTRHPARRRLDRRVGAVDDILELSPRGEARRSGRRRADPRGRRRAGRARHAAVPRRARLRRRPRRGADGDRHRRG